MKPQAKRFYFTVHPGDLLRGRLPEGCSIMLVASAHWDERQRRFRVRRPPADHVASLSIDSGGFTAARKWGTYPWTPVQYADWARETARDYLPGAPGGARLDFVATMDYACEKAVNRDVLRTNRDRIKASIWNEIACREADPSLPWLPVLQGDSLAERRFDLELRRWLGLLPTDYAGVGSICGRGARSAVRTLLFLKGQLPACRYHAFGLHVGALDHPDAWQAVRSWDSYSWTWPRGAKQGRPGLYVRQEDESRSVYTRRLARLYFRDTVAPRLMPPRGQLTLL